MGNICVCEPLRRSLKSAKPVRPIADVLPRTTSKALFRLRCSERPSIGQGMSHPVRLVVFDFDECLTLVTFMTKDGTYQPHQVEYAKKVNFESPWVEGNRIGKLNQLFHDLVNGADGVERVLAILTRNSNSGGVAAVLGLLRLAGLADHFSAIWTMPWRHGSANGAYQQDGKWKFFDPPINQIKDHKADALHHLVENKAAWFPQLSAGGKLVQRLDKLRKEEVVLVDDQRANFQSDSGRTVLRFAKVARYDAVYLNMGLVRNMGGIGAHDDADYDALKRFVEDPWMCKETLQIRCQEREFEGSHRKLPISMVVFDFDETMTLSTFMPNDQEFVTRIGWTPSSRSEWTKSDLVEYNFESPYVDGSRVAKLKTMLKSVSVGNDGKQRSLVILTYNEGGVIAVLNLLKMAGLAEHFSAIWTLPWREGMPNGAYNEGGTWKTFEPPVQKVHDHKAEVLKHVVDHPEDWFPQLASSREGSHIKALKTLSPESVALIDDERTNFRSCPSCVVAEAATPRSGDVAKVLRYAKVARYDDVYRDCGVLNQMGGIGAHSDADYATVKAFIEQPWDYPYEPHPTVNHQRGQDAMGKTTSDALGLQREPTQEEPSKRARKRFVFSTT